MAAAVAGNNLVEVGAVGVSNKNLTEAVAGYHIDDALHPAGIEFVEDVVEQQDGHGRVVGFKEIELGKSQGDGIGLALALAARAAHGVAVEQQFQVVTVDAAAFTALPTLRLQGSSPAKREWGVFWAGHATRLSPPDAAVSNTCIA